MNAKEPLDVSRRSPPSGPVTRQPNRDPTRGDPAHTGSLPGSHSGAPRMPVTRAAAGFMAVILVQALVGCSRGGGGGGGPAAAAIIPAHVITASAGAGGAISPSGSVSVNDGDSRTFTITADPGYRTLNVDVDAFSLGPVDSYTFQDVTEDHTITATFTPSDHILTVTKSGTGSGTVTSSPAGINCGSDCAEGFDAGTAVVLQATPDASSTFAGWSGSCSGTGPCQVTMNGDRAVGATFVLKTYTITATAGPGGNILPSGDVTVAHGGSRVFTIEASSGYGISDVEVDGGSVGAVPTYTFGNVTESHTIHATFVAAPGKAILTWEAPTENADGTPLTDLTGYKVYYGTSSGSYDVVVDVGDVTTCTIEGLSAGTYYFSVTAYNSLYIESEHSNQASKMIP